VRLRQLSGPISHSLYDSSPFLIGFVYNSSQFFSHSLLNSSPLLSDFAYDSSYFLSRFVSNSSQFACFVVSQSFALAFVENLVLNKVLWGDVTLTAS
jgi:hypothetical protein